MLRNIIKLLSKVQTENSLIFGCGNDEEYPTLIHYLEAPLTINQTLDDKQPGKKNEDMDTHERDDQSTTLGTSAINTCHLKMKVGIKYKMGMLYQ